MSITKEVCNGSYNFKNNAHNDLCYGFSFSNIFFLWYGGEMRIVGRVLVYLGILVFCLQSLKELYKLIKWILA